MEGDRLRLRRPEEGDVEARLRAGRDRGFVRGFGDDPATVGPITRERAEGWYERASSAEHGWVVEFEAQAVGSARLERHGAASSTARYAIGIWRPDLRGRGLGQEATRLVLEHAFTDLGLHRVELRVLARNTGAVRCYRKCGFTVEGRLREVLFEGGAWEDELHMAVLDREFPPDGHT